MKRTTLAALIFIFCASQTSYSQPLIVHINDDSGEGSLRSAIDSANQHHGPDTIVFDLTNGEAGTISLLSPLPIITDPGLTVLGTAEILEGNGSSFFLPEIWIVASEFIARTDVGLIIAADDVHIRHLAISGFTGGGILFDDVDLASVSGCFVGVLSDDGGDKRSVYFGSGIALSGSSHISVGPSPDVPFGNVISGFPQHGVLITDSSSFNVVVNNNIGEEGESKSTRYFSEGNGMSGIAILEGSHFNELFGNRIRNNSSHGIEIKGSKNNIIEGNQIGSALESERFSGNVGSGVYLYSDSKSNGILNNQIIANAGYGILNEGTGTVQNLFSRNIITKNQMNGILNSMGGNSELLPPVLQSWNNLLLSGTAGTGQIVEVFFDEGSQGGVFVDTVIADASGFFQFSLPIQPGSLAITATARDQFGNTSIFSNPLKPSTSTSIWEVTTTVDDGPGSLRSALLASNDHLGPDTIRFNIPKTDINFNATEGFWKFAPISQLPLILDDALFIDGPSQAQKIGEDSNPFGPEIVLSGENDTTSSNGISVLGSRVHIYGLTVQHFKGVGVSFHGSEDGIISGCYIGTSHDGMQAAGNNDGLVLGAGSNHCLIGPTDYLPVGNIISGNGRIGLFVVDTSSYNFIVGNQIGMNRTNSDTLRNRDAGVSLSRACQYNQVSENVIAGNWIGIYLVGSDLNVMVNNQIGVDVNGFALGNRTGIYLWMGSKQNIIIGNRIQHSEEIGIYNQDSASVENLFSKNYFLDNHFAHIINFNGANLELPPPSDLAISQNALTGKSAANQVIELYVDREMDGTTYFDSVATNASGEFFYLFDTMPTDGTILTTARDTMGNTSQFSEPFRLTTSIYEPIPSPISTYRIHPNPASKWMTLSFDLDEATAVDISLINIQGQVVDKISKAYRLAGHHTIDVDLFELPEGIYYVNLQTDSGSGEAIRIMVAR